MNLWRRWVSYTISRLFVWYKSLQCRVGLNEKHIGVEYKRKYSPDLKTNAIKVSYYCFSLESFMRMEVAERIIIYRLQVFVSIAQLLNWTEMVYSRTHTIQKYRILKTKPKEISHTRALYPDSATLQKLHFTSFDDN